MSWVNNEPPKLEAGQISSFIIHWIVVRQLENDDIVNKK